LGRLVGVGRMKMNSEIKLTYDDLFSALDEYICYNFGLTDGASGADSVYVEGSPVLMCNPGAVAVTIKSEVAA
jgi:hypothetical protein